MNAAIVVLILFLIASLARNRQLRRRIAALQAESARALEDDGLMAQIETAAVLGQSALAHRLLGAAKSSPPLLPSSHIISDHAGFEADSMACGTPSERFEVLLRWHTKGYVIPAKRRGEFLRGAADKSTRDALRKIFDEQDARQKLASD